VTTLWTIFFCAYQIPSSRDTHAQSLRGAYITQRSPLPLTIFPNIFLFLELSHFLLVSIPPATSLLSFFFVSSTFLRIFHSSLFYPHMLSCHFSSFFLTYTTSFSLLAFSHAGNSNSCRNCVFPQDSYSSWLPCDLHLQSSLQVSSYFI
jgi:hypothetical protein